MTERAVRSLAPEEIKALENAATSVDTLETEHMDSRVFDMSLKAKNAGDERLADTYRLIAGVLCSRVELMSNINASTDQFHITPASLTEEECSLLASLVEQMSDPELRARFADYLWMGKRDRKYGEIAVDEYLASALRLRDPENWTGCAGRYERAAKLAASLGKKNERFTRTVAIIEDYLKKLDGSDPLFLSERLMSTLLDLRQGAPSQYAQLAEKCALAAEARGNFYLALHYWNVQLRWYTSLDDSAGQQRARIAAAESVIRDGESRTVGEQASFGAAASFLRRGLAMLAKAGAPQERIDEIAARVTAYQRRGLTELKKLGATFDASAFITAARAAVAGKTLPDAIAAFAEMPRLPNRATVRREVSRRARTFIFTHLFPEVKLNAEGAPIAGRGTVSGDETEETKNVLALMYQDVVSSFGIEAQATIHPAWRVIQDEHEIREEDMSVIAQQSWFVPSSREPFFAKGLAAGFNGDLITAVHVLVPQIEGAIRWHLKSRSINTVRQNRDGYDEERDLNQLLALPETKTLLGDSLHFTLTALLTSRFGYNLRNNLAHALIEPRDCYSTISLFFFAVVVMICVQTMPDRTLPDAIDPE